MDTSNTINDSSTIDLGDYTRDTGLLISRDLNISLEEGIELATSIVNDEKRAGRVQVPVVEYQGKDQYGDRVLRKKSLISYIKGAKNGIIAPSGTVYKSHDVELSIHADNTKERVRKRSICKKEGFLAEQRGDINLFNKKEKFQKTYKAANNSLTGLLDNQYNPHYCPSSHYSLTSVTASVTSIGNSLGESMNAGNRMYTRPEIVINHIVSTSTNSDMPLIRRLISKYNLYIPTITDCMYVILKSTRFYWHSKERDEEIEHTLSLMTDEERAAFVYINDLYHLRYYNPLLMKTIISGLIEVHDEEITDMDTAMKGVPEDIEILSKTILYDRMLHHAKNEEVVSFRDNLYRGTKEKLVGTGRHSMAVLDKYDDLIRGFFKTKCLPVNIADVKKLVRACTVLSDTDSTCATYQDWVLWYFNISTPKFTSAEIGVTGAVLLIFTRALSHYLELFSTRMNIKGEYVKMLAMKNEFYWNVMVFTGMTKHYFADVAIREGNVFRETKLELKGSNLINSTLPSQIKKLSDGYFMKTNKLIASGQKINLSEILSEVAGIEQMVLRKLKNLDSDILKEEVISDASGYKLARDKSPFFHILLWNEVFAPKYGEVKNLPAVTVKLKTIMTTKKRIVEGIKLIPDSKIRDRFTKFLERYPKDRLEILRIPKEIIIGSGVPEDLEVLMTFRPAVQELCSTFYTILLTLGYFRKPGTLISDIYAPAKRFEMNKKTIELT